ncbi:hypothetical protein [Microcystis phage Mae-JY29]
MAEKEVAGKSNMGCLKIGMICFAVFVALIAVGAVLDDGSADQVARKQESELPPQSAQTDDAEQSQPVSSTGFEEDAYEFCTAKDKMWLMNLLNRIQMGLPEEFVLGTLKIDWPRPNDVIIQQRMSPDGQLTEERELMLHLKVDRAGTGTIKLPVYGRINPKDCKVDQIEAQVGYLRLDPETERFAIE